ncbi:hypothetical protein KVT40_004632 [Elsinoe batatas]|uniref:Uncharacterized protein n=1 Tax=Elsinoe batatas TaxID=2601811 RepID=A0A8K0PIY2_9PEZI|nr:hypothetical protein KVT40_004632 [Elsinoe batatas]
MSNTQDSSTSTNVESIEEPGKGGDRPILERLPYQTYVKTLTILTFPLVLGGFLFMALLPSDRRRGRAEQSEDTPNEELPHSMPARSLRSSLMAFFKDHFLKPTSVWVPIFTMTFCLFQVFWSMDRATSGISTLDFDTSCPLDGRRTQTGVLVKLFAATVTTICVHGHLGSLAGSGSIRRELFRAVEVLLSPLTPAFTLIVMIWLDLAQSLPSHKGSLVSAISWPASAYQSSTCRSLYLRRDLKWLGRLLILIILLGQNVQAAVLLVRRIVSKRYATVDVAMFLMVISGITGLLQSLLITFIHTNWAGRSRSISIVVVQQSDLIQSRNLKLLGFINLKSGVTRMIIHMMVAGFVQLQVALEFARMPVKDIIFQLIGMVGSTQIVLRVLLLAEGALDLVSKPRRDLVPDNTTTTTEFPAPELANGSSTAAMTSTSAPSTPTMATSESDTRGTIFFTILFATVSILSGLVAIAALLSCIVIQLWYLFGPFATIHRVIAEETSSWRDWNTKAPCPQLWKDSLEDELWWF